MDVGGFEIRASAKYISSIHFATSLKRRSIDIATTEHILSAAYALGIDNLVVELDAAEVPIMDGSSAPFIYLLGEAGIRTLPVLREAIRILSPIRINGPDKSIAVYPSDELRVTYAIKFQHPLIQYQSCSLTVTPDVYSESIAPARTFCFLKDVEMMRKKGLATGGSLDNAVVLDEYGILNDKLRFEDEFVRHKILDVIGDLALLGRPLLGHVVVYKGGHALHAELVHEILRCGESWVIEKSPAGEIKDPARCPVLAPKAPTLAS
jgi:UDP-3-O-[3-hydroxymyristoyl] N-acetylglucosamine deacetylase